MKNNFRAPELKAHPELEHSDPHRHRQRQMFRVISFPMNPRSAAAIPALALIMGMSGFSLTACNKKSSAKKTNPAASASPNPQKEIPERPEGADGTGTAPPFVGTQDFQPYADLTPQTGKALPQQMNELGALIYGYDLPFDVYSVENFVPSPAEEAGEQCLNDYLSQIKFQLAAQTGNQPAGATPSDDANFNAVVPDKAVFNTCMEQKQRSTPSLAGISTDFKVNIFLSCQGNGKTGPNLANVAVTAPEWHKGFCETGTKSEVRYNISLEVKQTKTAANSPNQSPVQASPAQTNGDGILRYYKRTKALTSRSAGTCTWTKSPAENVKSFNDCVFLDRVDVQNNATARFAYVEFDRVVGQQSLSGGFQFTGGRAKVRLNNFEGEITFRPSGAPAWSMTKSGTQNATPGQLAIPQGHGMAPTGVPGGGAGPGPGGSSQTGVITWITGPAGEQELRCGPQVTAQNIRGTGNGFVTQHSLELGNISYHAGYFHENQTDARTSFLARIENNQIVWCRTYVVKNVGSSEGLFIAIVGGQLYGAFVSNKDVYIPIGSAVYQSVRSPQDIPSIYLVKFEPTTGNPMNATWFNTFSAEGAALRTVILDGQQLGEGFVRLRAFLTQARPPGCDATATGDYGIVLKSDLSALANERAEFCPGQQQ